MRARKNLIAFIQKSGKTLSEFAASVNISISQLSQISHGKQEGTFIFWSTLATVYNLTIEEVIELYQREEIEVM